MQVAVIHAVVTAPARERDTVHDRAVDAVRALSVSSLVTGEGRIEVTVEVPVGARPGAFDRRVQQVQGALAAAVARPMTWSPASRETR